MMLWVEKYTIDLENAASLQATSLESEINERFIDVRGQRLFFIESRSGLKFSIIGDLSRRHSTRFGFDWVLRSSQLPQLSAPFLVTTDDRWGRLYHGRIRLRLNEFSMRTDSSLFEGALPVSSLSRDILGVMEACVVEDRGILAGTFTSFAYSTTNTALAVGRVFCFEETGEELGTLVEEKEVNPQSQP